MALDIPLLKTYTGQKRLSFLEPKISKIKPSIEKVKKMASMHALKKNNLPHLQE